MGRARGRVEAVLLEFLSKRGLGPGDEVAVAYSGGPDSTALLAALSALGWARPLAIHVDHGIRERGELDAELALVRSLCSALGARLIVARLRPGAVLARAESSGEGVEAEARRFRYAALRAALRGSGAKALLLAHTRDDQVETLLMRVFGGSGSGGLTGIPETRGPLMRPFLGLEKSALLDYLRERGLSYSVDSTNASVDYLRNRIRNVAVPALDAALPGWRRGLALTSAKAARDEAALAEAAAHLEFLPLEAAEGELSLPDATLLEAQPAVALRALVAAAGRLLGRERLSSGLALAAMDAIRGDAAGRYIGGGIELFRRDGLAILRRGLDFPRRGGYFVLIDRPLRVCVGSLSVSAEWDSVGRSGIRADAFRFPLVVRSRRPGDSIALKKGRKRLDALFSDWALSEAARRAAPIVEDRDGIVAVLGEGLGGKDRYRDGPQGECAHRLSIIVKGA
jgi:tRNA(Ile)-lysidine synthetase-like protein